MAGLILGSEDDWRSELAEHPELASLRETSLFEDGALEEALANLADGADADAAGAGSNGPGAGGRRRAAGAGEPTLEELLAGAVDLAALGAGAAEPGAVAADSGADAAGGDGRQLAETSAGSADERARRAPERPAQAPARAGVAFARERGGVPRASRAGCAEEGAAPGERARSDGPGAAPGERARSGSPGAARQAVRASESPLSRKQRVFDLHCDTLDRLCLRHFAPQNLWTEQDADVPEADRSSLAHNACHLALDRMAAFSWCQCFAVFIPDEFRCDAAWRLFQQVSAYFQQQMEAHADLVEQARDARRIDEILAAGKTAAVLTVEGAAFLENPLFEGQPTASSAPWWDDAEELLPGVRVVDGPDGVAAEGAARAAGAPAGASLASPAGRRARGVLAAQRGAAQDARGQARGLDRIALAAEAGVKMMTLTWNGPNALGSGHETRDGLTRFGREVVREMEAHRMVVDVSHLNDRGFSDLVEVATRPFAASHSNARSVCGHRRNLTDAQARTIFEGGGIVGLNYCRDFLREGSGDVTPDAVLRQVDRLLELGGERGLALGSDYDGTDVPTWLDGCERVGTLHELIARHFGREVAERVFYENARDFFLRNEQ